MKSRTKVSQVLGFCVVGQNKDYTTKLSRRKWDDLNQLVKLENSKKRKRNLAFPCETLASFSFPAFQRNAAWDASAVILLYASFNSLYTFYLLMANIFHI